MVDVLIVNPGYNTWLENQNEWLETQNAANDNAVIQLALQTAQLVAYYTLADTATDNRDTEIDKQIAFMTKLNEYKFDQDLEMLNDKSAVLKDLKIPLVEMCADAVRGTEASLNDGDAVDAKALDYVNQSCGDVPEGWGLHDGNLFAAKSASHVGGVIANSARREQENFRQTKTDLVRGGQQGMKAVFSAETVLAQYSQAAAIHGGLADLFIQGFNSAGAGLGVALERLENSSGVTSNVANGPTDNGPQTVLGFGLQ